MAGRLVYNDGLVELDETGITLRRYYFPFGTAKHIPYEKIRGVQERQLSGLTGRSRLWGTANPRYWAPLDLHRVHKSRALVLDLGRRVSRSSPQPTLTR